MSIALPTLLLVAALIPGIAFVNFFYAGKFPRQLTNLSPLAELALYFLWALPIDAIALHTIRSHLTGSLLGLAGQLFHPPHTRGPADEVVNFLEGEASWNWTWCYAEIVIAGAVAGFVSRRLVWALRLDVLLPPLKLRAEWFYVLTGRTTISHQEILPQADVLVTHPSGSRLYVGVVSGFEPSRDGSIEQLYISGAQRYRKDENGRDQLIDVPGDVLAISGSIINSINMRYYVQRPPTKSTDQVVWYLKSLLWGLLREE